MVVTKNEKPWNHATNFIRAASPDSSEGLCWRYDRISRQLKAREGRFDADAAIELLKEVAQEGTQWSIVYGIGSGEIHVVMGRRYETIHSFTLGTRE
jgi:hypothetical protein